MFGRLFSGREKKLDRPEETYSISRETQLDTTQKKPVKIEPDISPAVLPDTRDIYKFDTEIVSVRTYISTDYSMEDLLESMIHIKASDLYLTSYGSPYFRINGKTVKSDLEPVSQDKCKELLEQICSEEQNEDLETSGEVGFSFEIKDSYRFRVSIFKENGGYGGVFKRIPLQILSFQDLNLPSIVENIAFYNKGLVLITGPSESGKTTTMASIIDYINQHRKSLIITIENPVEFFHNNEKSIVIHREIGTNVYSYKEALQAALKEDPDVVFIGGELKDSDITLLALQAAEMGSLVFCCLHLDSAYKAIKRILDFFPQEKSSQIAFRLSLALKAVIAQRLVPAYDNNGLCLATEVMLNSKKIPDLIRSGNLEKINSVMSKSKKIGMQTMNDALSEMVEIKMISSESARNYGCELSVSSSEDSHESASGHEQ